jgi:hypothetical protein
VEPFFICTNGTYSYSSVTLVIRDKSLRSVLSPSDVYLRDHSASDLWYLMTYVSRVPMGPFSISIRPVWPDRWLTCHEYLWDNSSSPSDLWDPTACVSLVLCVPSGFNFSKKGLMLSVFDDRQLVMRLPGTIVHGAGEPGNLTVTQGTSNLYWFGSSWSSKSLYVQLVLAFALDWWYDCVYKGCPWPLFIYGEKAEVQF